MPELTSVNRHAVTKRSVSTMGIVIMASIVSFVAGGALYSLRHRSKDAELEEKYSVNKHANTKHTKSLQNEVVNTAANSQNIQKKTLYSYSDSHNSALNVNNCTSAMQIASSSDSVESQLCAHSAQMFSNIKTEQHRTISNISYDAWPKLKTIYNCNGILKDVYEWAQVTQYTDPHIYSIARYYVNLVQEDIKQDYLEPQKRRNRMWILAKQAFDEFVEHEVTGHNISTMHKDHMRDAHEARKIIVQYLNRVRVIALAFKVHEYDETLDNIAPLEEIREILAEHIKSPHITLSVDLMFTNFAYIASIQQKENDDEYNTTATQVTADYIASSLAHIAYAPCSQNICRFRSAHKKLLCLNKLAVYRTAYGVMLEPSLQHVDMDSVTDRLEQYAGHICVLSQLCTTNCIAMVFCYQALMGYQSESYIDTLIHKTKAQNITTYMHFIGLQKQLRICQNKKSFVAISVLLCEKAIGLTLAIDANTQRIALAKQLFNAIAQLHTQELKILLDNIIKNAVVTKATGAIQSILELANHLSYDLYQLYIMRYSICVPALRDAQIVQKEVDIMLRRRLNEYDSNVVRDIGEVFMQPKMHPTEAANMLITINMLDTDCLTQDLYSLDPEVRNTTLQSGDAAQAHILYTALNIYNEFLLQ